MGMDAGMGMEMGAAAAGMGAAGIITVLKYVLITLGGGILLGIIFGLVFAGIKYPNPNKRALFSPVQKIIVIVVAVLGIAMIIYAFTKKPGSNVPAGADASMGQIVDENGVTIEKPDADGAGGDSDGAVADSAEGDASDAESSSTAEGEGTASESTAGESDASSEASSEAESSSVSSTATASKSPVANAAPKATYRMAGRGGMVIMG